MPKRNSSDRDGRRGQGAGQRPKEKAPVKEPGREESLVFQESEAKPESTITHGPRRRSA